MHSWRNLRLGVVWWHLRDRRVLLFLVEVIVGFCLDVTARQTGYEERQLAKGLW